MRLEKTDLVELDPSLLLELRYATERNFTGKKIYPQARAFLQRDAADALLRANDALKKQGMQLKVLDAYRPLSVQKLLWEVVPDERYVANPKVGSNHNRGMAVDVTLADREGKDVPMPTQYDTFTQKAHRDCMDLPAQAIANRDLMASAMHHQGFQGIPTEWWHFDYRGWEKHPLLDIPFWTADSTKQRRVNE